MLVIIGLMSLLTTVVLYMLICNNAIAYSTFSVIFSFSSLLVYVLVIIGLMSLLTLLFMGFLVFLLS